MNQGEKILYDVRPELAELMSLPSPTDRSTILRIFVDFCIEHDIIDLHCHQYNVSRHPRLRALLGIDVLQCYDIFKHLRGLIIPFSPQDREIERRKIAAVKENNQLALELA
jgi:hypothetical protein